MSNVLFKRGNTATINGTAISDGQLLYNTTTGQQYIDSGSTRKEVGKPVDTALSTTSTNAIANNAITTSIVNTTAEVSAITVDNIPCGTKPVKELITSLSSTPTNNYIDLSAYTSTSPYTTPTDGYVYLQCEPGMNTQFVVGVVESSITFIARSNGTTNGSGSFYIKKGMSLYNLSIVGDVGFMRFYPCEN